LVEFFLILYILEKIKVVQILNYKTTILLIAIQNLFLLGFCISHHFNKQTISLQCLEGRSKSPFSCCIVLVLLFGQQFFCWPIFLAFLTFMCAYACVPLVSHLLLIFYDTVNILQCEFRFHGMSSSWYTSGRGMLSIQYAQQSVTCSIALCPCESLPPTPLGMCEYECVYTQWNAGESEMLSSFLRSIKMGWISYTSRRTINHVLFSSVCSSVIS